MARGTPLRFEGFARGYNPLDAPMSVAEGFADDPNQLGMAAFDCLNVTTDKHGKRLFPRWGATALFTGAGFTGANGLSVFNTTGSTIVAITAESGGTLAVLDSFGNRSVPAGASGGLASAGFKWLRMPTIGAQGPFYGMNGTNARCLDANCTTAANWTATAGTLPVGTMMVYANNRLWVSGVAGNPYSVYFSEIGDPTNWPVENVVQFSPSDGKPVTGIQVCGPYLLVFKSKSIFKIYDLDTGANEQVSDSAGTISPNALVSVGENCYFLDQRRGISVTDGSLVRVVGQAALPFLSPATGGLATSQASTAVYAGERIYWSVTKQVITVNPTTHLRTVSSAIVNFEYVPEFDSVWPFSSSYKDLALVPTDGTSAANGSLWGLTLASGFTPYQLVTAMFGVGQNIDSRPTTDLGSGYSFYWRGPFHRFARDGLRKRVRKVQLDGTGQVAVSYQTDFRVTDEPTASESTSPDMTPSTATGTPVTAPEGVAPLGEAAIYNPGTVRSLSLTLSGISVNRFELDGYTVYVDPRKD